MQNRINKKAEPLVTRGLIKGWLSAGVGSAIQMGRDRFLEEMAWGVGLVRRRRSGAWGERRNCTATRGPRLQGVFRGHCDGAQGIGGFPLGHKIGNVCWARWRRHLGARLRSFSL